MALNWNEFPDEVIVSFAEETLVDEDLISKIGRLLHDVSKQAADARKRLIVDFRGVRTMSSAMIGKLVLLHQTAKRASLELRVSNVSPELFEVFERTRLNQCFRNDDDTPGQLGTGVPKPKSPDTLDGRAEPPSE